jgi:hypothetical protein
VNNERVTPDDPQDRPTPTDAPAAPEADAQAPVASRLVGRVADAVEDAVGDAVDVARAAVRRWDERPGARVRRVRRAGRRPLPVLREVHPEERAAAPRELGVQTIDVDRIAGTAAGTAVPRGGDFLPTRAFRTRNWQARWQRLRKANDRLAVLPPIDVLKYGDRYWVVDGHNRVATALYAGQPQIDANVTELIPPGGRPSERPASLAPVLTGSQALRTAGRGQRVGELSHEDRVDEPPEST